ncbi:MAG TPA: glycosyltransferase [Nevskiaceae bacterium]|nr:glycosyltransferase [Nevskiaceae bacterium]
MSPNRPTICLNMIVKNEAHVIRRCLDSVRPLIDTWVIVDTGSTDGTQDVIREHLRDLPGTLHERPWKGFGASRTEALELARGAADYLFFIDADDQMEVPAGFRMPHLAADLYEVEIRHAQLLYWRPALVATRHAWRWVGVLHEYLDCEVDEPTRERLHGVRMLYMSGGGRSQVDQRTKYLRDAAVLEGGLVDEPDNARYVFYLGQSYRDAGEPEKALVAYDRRTTMGGFDEEVFCAHLNAARLAAQVGRPSSEIVDRYLRAHESRPKRAEALGDLARWCRENGPRWPLAYLFGKAASAIPQPDDILFVESEWYAWRALDEYAIAAYWVGAFQESNDACERLLQAPGLPATQRPRVTENLNFALRKLGRPTVTT